MQGKEEKCQSALKRAKKRRFRKIKKGKNLMKRRVEQATLRAIEARKVAVDPGLWQSWYIGD